MNLLLMQQVTPDAQTNGKSFARVGAVLGLGAGWSVMWSRTALASFDGRAWAAGSNRPVQQ